MKIEPAIQLETGEVIALKELLVEMHNRLIAIENSLS